MLITRLHETWEPLLWTKLRPVLGLLCILWFERTVFEREAVFDLFLFFLLDLVSRDLCSFILLTLVITLWESTLLLHPARGLLKSLCMHDCLTSFFRCFELTVARATLMLLRMIFFLRSLDAIKAWGIALLCPRLVALPARPAFL